MLFKIRKSDVSTHYHNTRTFLNKYRDISWILEVSALNLQKEFKATYELFRSRMEATLQKTIPMPWCAVKR